MYEAWIAAKADAGRGELAELQDLRDTMRHLDADGILTVIDDWFFDDEITEIIANARDMLKRKGDSDDD